MNTVQELQQIDTGVLKKFAQAARRKLREQVAAQLDRVIKNDSAELREREAAIKELKNQIETSSREAVIERVAYVWFNRLCALRFMDVNQYTRIGTVSPADGFTQPELLAEAKQGHIDESLKSFINGQRVFDLLNGRIPSKDPQQEAYRLLIVAVCNYYNAIMPFLFEKIADYTELLMPDDLLSESSILADTRNTLSTEACRDVEVIGWLYQFYISEKKDEVFEDLKKNKKISPENIPAATQLFTPHWIVRYLIENSLGRLWMLNKPQSRLIDCMDYYIKPEQQPTNILRVQKPEELRICDPACGSGHMLVYAFDLLYKIYEEEGYEPTEIPRLILENNLYGIEIDERAAELAAFALAMKARQKYRRFFSNPTQPNICVLENVVFEQQELLPYLNAVGNNLFTSNLRETLHQFREASNFGSLIRPKVTDVETLLAQLESKSIAGNLLLYKTHERVIKVLTYVDYLRPKYHVVVANPPYMGFKGMNGRLATWLKDNYPDVKTDLFSAFILRNTELALSHGQLGYMSPFVWMFISSYEKLRKFLIHQKTITSLVQLEYSGFDGATVPICTFTIENAHHPNFKGGYVRLSDFRGPDLQGPKTLQAIKEPGCSWFYRASADDFDKIPGTPIAYWVSKNVRRIFVEAAELSRSYKAVQGLITGDTERFARLWHEVDKERTFLTPAAKNEASRSGKKWFPYNKGGNYRKWYGNNEFVVNWENDGHELKNFKDDNGKLLSRPQNENTYFAEGLTWTAISSSYFAVRYCPPGSIGSNAGMMIFSADGSELNPLLGFLNSSTTSYLISCLTQTLNFDQGIIAKLPLLNTVTADRVAKLISLTKHDWDSYETSWNFSTLPLLDPRHRQATLPATYSKLREHWRQTVSELHDLERANNQSFIEAYGLQNELNPDIRLSDITLTCNPHYRYDADKNDQELESLLRADSIKELISFAVGCMFGRYSLDKPGLILANQGDTKADYSRQIPEPTFPIDDDNVIPILDGDWFTDDISEGFRKFLRVCFGDEHYQHNMQFVENALGKDIRKYFTKDFYNDHVKRYKKRPIYWLFSSPKGTFNALIYMHRYRPDTVSVVLNDYLREFRNKLSARKNHLEAVTVSANVGPAEKTKALKEIESLKKAIDELDTYERELLYSLATQKIQIDLDDGVKVNYAKFGRALKAIPGMSSEDD